MYRFTVVVAVASIFLSPMTALAGDGSQQTGTQANDLDQVICRSGEPVTGSRLPGPRVCHTKRQWNDMRRQSQDATTHIQAESKQIGF